MRLLHRPAVAFVAFSMLASASVLRAEEAADFSKVQPLLKEYCLNCHSTEKQKGDLDLEVFGSVDEIKRHPKIWQGVLEQLETREMPPKAKPQPAPEQRAQLVGWTRGMLETMARERAGDPGPVVLRRLSNAEYTYTVRDLTGVPNLDPAREFPADGAAGEGFTNTGQALVMSPALLTKYLEASKAIASHAMLLPNGIRFSEGTTRRDWAEELKAQIQAFYRRYTAPGGGEQVNLQGIKFETNSGGRLPLEQYFGALLQARASLSTHKETPEAVAARTGLNGRYLTTLWQALLGRGDSWLLDDLRTRFQRAKSGDERTLAEFITGWQRVLWKLDTVGYVGVPGKPTALQATATPFLTRQEFRLKVPALKPGEDLTVKLVSTAVGDPPAPSYVVWEKPRLVIKGRPDVLARDFPPGVVELPESESGSAKAGEPIEMSSIVSLSPGENEIGFPVAAASAPGAEFVVTARLAKNSPEAAVHVAVYFGSPSPAEPYRPFAWPRPAPLLIGEKAALREKSEAGFAAFRELFPAVLCYDKITPSDEVVTLLQYYREDDQLARLMLSEAEKAELDRLWTALRFVSRDALTQVDALLQIIEYATQDSDPKPFRAAKPAFEERAAKLREDLLSAEPRQLASVLELAGRAYRRPLTEREGAELRALYARLRREELPHEEALRLTIAKVFTAPAFLYRLETPAPGATQAPITAPELATRLSYFLWSSLPDAELLSSAGAGRLTEPAELRAQTHRLLAGPFVRRLATEFGAQWLHLRDFEALDEKSPEAFPAFRELRGAMLEETVQTFTDLFQNDRSVLSLLDTDHTFLNEALAKHYGIAGVNGAEWRRVEGVRQQGRGGLLAQAAVLSKQAGASRTSPILRGDFIVETLLGEKIPRPPKDVPPFPDEKSMAGLTIRQITEKHSSDARCAHCHARMDAFGFTLESFDGIGRRRTQDEAGRPFDTRVSLPDGTALEGLDGLRTYLVTTRRDDFLRQFCRKLLGFALGRGVQLSDEPLLTEMRTQLAAQEFKVSTAVDCIVQSRQFREIRGAEMKDLE